MPKIHYSQVIEEDAQELKELERYHRYTHLFQRVRMLRLLKTEECTNLGEAARALGYSWRQCHRWFASYKKGGLQELLKSRVSERGRQELVTPEAFEELQEAMKRGRSPPYLRLTSSLESATASSTLTLTASANSSGDARSSLRRVVPATRKPTKKSRRPSKKLRRPGRAGGRWPRQTVEGFGLRRGTLRADQLAQEALLPEGVPSALHVRRSYEWTYLYAAVEPTTGESFCLYLPGMDDGCLQIFLGELSKAYPENHLLVVLDGAPSHRSEKIVHPENVSLLEL